MTPDTDDPIEQQRVGREAMAADLLEIAHASAAMQADRPRWTEDDLYDEAGPPA